MGARKENINSAITAGTRESNLVRVKHGLACMDRRKGCFAPCHPCGGSL